MTLRTTIVPLSFLIASSVALAGQRKFSQLERVEPDGDAFRKLEYLFITSSEVNPPLESLVTYADAMEWVEIWLENHPHPNQEQRQLIDEIRGILDHSKKSDGLYRTTVRTEMGVDILHRPRLNEDDPTSLYFIRFKDRDFVTKYENRHPYFSLELQAELWNHFLISADYEAREDWKHLNTRDNYYPRNLRELNLDFNRRAIALFRYYPLTLIAGRDKIGLGIGEHGKLLLSDNTPPLDQIRLSIRLKDKLTFNSIIAPVKFVPDESAPPKILSVHRLDWRISKRLKLGLTESVLTNQHLGSIYMNPFLVYHNVNVASFSTKRNSLGSLDFELVLFGKAKTYLGFAIDEIFSGAFEAKKAKANKQAIGLQLGLKLYNPFDVSETQMVVELVKLDKWMYNHPYPGGTLTYVYEREDFYRFIGHYLGSNVKAGFLDYHFKRLSVIYQFIEQGEVPIFRPAFTETTIKVRETKQTVGIRLSDRFVDGKLELGADLFYTFAENFHFQPGNTKNYPEFRIVINYDLFEYTEGVF